MTRKRPSRLLLLSALIMALGLIAAACSSTDDTTTTAAQAAASSTTTTAATTEPTETTEAPEPEQPISNTIVVSLSTDINILEQHLFRSTGSYAVTRALYQPLLDQVYTEKDGALLGTSEVTPSEILDSYDVAADGTATFTLNANAKFANGDPIKASDAVYMLQRSIDAPASYIPLLLPFIAIDSADSFTVVDDLTFTITPNQPTALFNRFMTFQVFGPIEQSLADANATDEDPYAFDYFTTNANASGPYGLGSWDQARGELVLEPNTGWPGQVANAGVIVRNVPDAAQRALLLQNGDLDVAAGLPPRLINELKDDPNINVYSAPSTRVNYIGMNATAEPNLANKMVRQAISYAIPYQALIDNVMFGFASTAGTLITSNMDTYQGEAAGIYTTDMAKATELMDASGVGPFEVELAVQNSRSQDQQAAVFIQDALRELGITVNINVLPDGEFAEKQNNRELAMFFHEWFSWGDDPFYQMTFLAKCGAFTNFAGACNERLDEIIAEGTFETDPAARDALGLEAQQLMVEDADRIYLWSADWNLATRSNITGVTKDFTEVPRFENLAKG
ncbi:MAG: ABC transporter substrate-binding protein [Acidimicrobiia bacterium]|nr:MAG: ABC transporter substrate-binding protein [Acidimicrobiia bacterium]